MTNGNDQVVGEPGRPTEFGFREGTVGLTKREMFAAMAMQGLMASTRATPNLTPEGYAAIPSISCNLADALINVLNERERQSSDEEWLTEGQRLHDAEGK